MAKIASCNIPEFVRENGREMAEFLSWSDNFLPHWQFQFLLPLFLSNVGLFGKNICQSDKNICQITCHQHKSGTNEIIPTTRCSLLFFHNALQHFIPIPQRVVPLLTQENAFWLILIKHYALWLILLLSNEQNALWLLFLLNGRFHVLLLTYI